MKFAVRLTGFLVMIALLGGCMAPGGDVDGRRRHIDAMSQQALRDLYRIRPAVRDEIEQAAGYAVFSNVSVSMVFVGGGSGYGVVEDQRNNRRTYMKMGEAGLGLGVGAKDFRAVMVFNNAGALKRFVTEGWAWGMNADAAARSETKGAAAAAEIVMDSVQVYQITEGGLLLNASLKGAKFWGDDELNGISHRAPVEDSSNASPAAGSSSQDSGGGVDYSEPVPVW
jgi:lipid-binding SYLF domain-containing protein